MHIHICYLDVTALIALIMGRFRGVIQKYRVTVTTTMSDILVALVYVHVSKK